MSQRVLATPEAGEAVTQVKGILDGGLQTTITNLKSQGTILSDPGVWDGALAADFRNNLWPQCTKALDDALVSLNELQTKLQQIQGNIMQAGGNQ